MSTPPVSASSCPTTVAASDQSCTDTSACVTSAVHASFVSAGANVLERTTITAIAPGTVQ